MHDERWVSALRRSGFSVSTLSLGRDNMSISEVRREIQRTGHPVIAGPLTEVTKELVGINAPLIGLSWGFDLVQADIEQDELTWLQQLSGLIVDCEHTRNIALRSGLDPSRIERIPWGIDLDLFAPRGPIVNLQNLGIRENSRIVLSLRALEPLYRVGDIVHAFAETAADISDAHLVIGNDGGLRRELELLIASLEIAHRVTFIGPKDERELPALFRAASAYVTASEVDGSSVTLLQAMGCGTPVLASDTPGNREWIEDGVTGHLFPVGGTTKLSDALTEILRHKDDEAARTIAGASRATVCARANWYENSRQVASILRA